MRVLIDSNREAYYAMLNVKLLMFPGIVLPSSSVINGPRKLFFYITQTCIRESFNFKNTKILFGKFKVHMSIQ
jgi:hypothetical protein